MAEMVPIKTEKSDYRPKYLLPQFLKITELILNKVDEFSEEYELVNDHQFVEQMCEKYGNTSL